MSLCFITGDFNSAHLIKVMSPRFLHCKVTSFPFVINKCFIGRSFETMPISYYSSYLIH